MTSMNAFISSNRPADSGYISLVWFATIFALVSYAAISIRAVLSPFEVNTFIDAKRLFSVALGAIILWLAIRATEQNKGANLSAQIVAILNVAIPGAIALLLAREAYDLAVSGEIAQRLALNIRWMLTWTGYFAAAIASFLALGYHRQLELLRASDTGLRDGLPHAAPLAKAGYESAEIEFDPRRQA